MQQFINKQQQLSLKLKLVQKARIAPGKRFIFKISLLATVTKPAFVRGEN